MKVLRDNPGLKPKLSGILLDAYQSAVIKAFDEAGVDESVFPPICPWFFEEIAKSTFYPD